MTPFDELKERYIDAIRRLVLIDKGLEDGSIHDAAVRKIWIVMAVRGEYSDATTYTVRGFLSQKKAEEYEFAAKKWIKENVPERHSVRSDELKSPFDSHFNRKYDDTDYYTTSVEVESLIPERDALAFAQKHLQIALGALINATEVIQQTNLKDLGATYGLATEAEDELRRLIRRIDELKGRFHG